MKKKMSNRDKTFWASCDTCCGFIFRIQHTADDKGCDLQLYKLQGLWLI